MTIYFLPYRKLISLIVHVLKGSDLMAKHNKKQVPTAVVKKALPLLRSGRTSPTTKSATDSALSQIRPRAG